MKEIQQLKFGELKQIAQIGHVNLKGHVDEFTGDLYVHLDIFEKDKWSVSLYKKMLDAWADIRRYLKEKLNIATIKTLIHDEDTVTEKFLNLFGFIAQKECFITEDGVSYVIMEMEF